MTSSLVDHDPLFVGGEWVPSDGADRYTVTNPATAEAVGEFVLPTTTDADRAVQAARHAFDSGPWPRMSIQERADVVRRLRDNFVARSADFDEAWLTESGPTISHCRLVHGFVPALIDASIEAALHLTYRERRELPDGEVEVVKEPIGVALLITAWNGPALYLAMKVVPALLSGCAVIIKPAIESQLTARLTGEIVESAGFPPGVVSVLAAGTEISEHLVRHQWVDKVSLTGSVPAGRSVMAAVAPKVGKLTLELGGKSAALVTEDVDLDTVLDSFVPGFIAGCGQVCVALTRLVVPRGMQAAVITGLRDRLAAMAVGDPRDTNSAVGPLGTARQLEKVEEYVASGLAEGARLVIGGRRAGDGSGFYYEPTVFADVAPSMRIAQEEIFGPVLCVMPYDDLEEAVQIANSTEYGLAASVYCADAERAGTLADRMQAGTVAINTAGISFFAPFGGVKQSGFGRELGTEGIEEFLQLKSIKVG